ncbi:hypothetical protein RvY_02196-2 [Ramazzottius varieornatus]|uniref:Uncharacterized protein n=1 Tax=Ramazzottius varieornatus TaxID=947166 RepID=A0A1D1UIZ2_RAMVA|nr:hypothetical protein RvY_02196-2 [Ramazzottius varieornatus]
MTLHSIPLLVLVIAASHLLGITTGFSLRIYPAFRDADPIIQRTPSAAYRAIPQQVTKVVPQPSSRTEADDIIESSSDTKPSTSHKAITSPYNFRISHIEL